MIHDATRTVYNGDGDDGDMVAVVVGVGDMVDGGRDGGGGGGDGMVVVVGGGGTVMVWLSFLKHLDSPKEMTTLRLTL